MTRTSNLVSAIIPCYNDGQYIREAIDSILSQTYKQVEVIVVNDGSDDDETLRILDTLEPPQITVYHKDNGGPASARNYGIKKCSGEYILTLDSDDKFAFDFVEKGLSILKAEPEIGMVTSYVKRYRGKNSSYFQLKAGGLENFLKKNDASACLLYRYKCWDDAGGYDEEAPGFEDWEFFINVTKQGWYVYSIPEYLFYQRERIGSTYGKDLEKKPEIIKYIVKKHKSDYQKHIVDVIYEWECKNRELRNEMNMYKNCTARKIGDVFLKPVRWLKKLSRN